jgi:hypothetical protein
MAAIWLEIWDGHPIARQIADRHYTRQKPGATLFVRPGEKMVLITPDQKALFSWSRQRFRDDEQEGVECALFRNEGSQLSSELIREACRWAWQRWHGERLFTYVRDAAIRSTNPGFCFQMAGWRKCGRNKFGKLTILEFLDYSDERPIDIGPKQIAMGENCEIRCSIGRRG